MQAVFAAAGLTDARWTGGVAYFAHVGRLRVRGAGDPGGGHARKAIAADRGGASMRSVLLVVAMVFIAGLGLLTALDIVAHGVNWLDVLAILILVLFGTGIVGALLQRPPGDDVEVSGIE